MNRATTTGQPTPEAEDPLDHPAGVLMYVIVALLAPMFLGIAGGNVGMARIAAVETVNAYRAQSHADLLAIAQIIGFGLAALGSLSLSMADDLTLPMTLRLRANANALNRSAEHNRRALRESQPQDPIPRQVAPRAGLLDALRATRTDPEPETANSAKHDAGQPSEDVFLDLAAVQALAAEAEARLRTPAKATVPAQPPVQPQIAAPTSTRPVAEKQRHQAIWAIAMLQEASEISASIPDLPPSECNTASIRVEALNNAANHLLTGAGAAPFARTQKRAPSGDGP